MRDAAGETVDLPRSVFEGLHKLVGFLAEGRTVAMFADDEAISIQRALS